MAAVEDDLQSRGFLTRISLASAGYMPVIYYGAQLVAAPFYPGYSFSHEMASTLGTSHSRQPWIFNLALMLTGIAAIIGSFGLYQTFRARSSPWLALLTALAVACTGFASFKAGVFPLPDPRHGSGGFVLSLTLITPLLMLIAIRRRERLQGLRAYLFASVLLLIPIFPLFKGKIIIAGLDAGTLQRLLALVTYVPIGVVGLFFFSREEPKSQ